MDENQQRFQQRQELEDQRQMQEQLMLDQQQDRLDNIRSAQNTFMNTQNPTSANVQLVTIPSSRRVMQVIDPVNYNFGYAVADSVVVEFDPVVVVVFDHFASEFVDS